MPAEATHALTFPTGPDALRRDEVVAPPPAPRDLTLPTGPDALAGLPRCTHCDYIVVGLPDDLCPECGRAIDWGRAYDDDEQRRLGSPARNTNLGMGIARAAGAVGMMLFRPITFARRLRWDEPIAPAVLIAAAACAIMLPEASRRGVFWVVIAGTLACMLVNGLAFVTIGLGREAPLRWRQRLRLFALVSLYSTCFVTAWPLTDPPLVDGPSANFLWLFDDHGWGEAGFLGRTLIFYWWWAILVVFASVRLRPRWRAAMFIPIPPIAAFTGHGVGAWVVWTF